MLFSFVAQRIRRSTRQRNCIQRYTSQDPVFLTKPNFCKGKNAKNNNLNFTSKKNAIKYDEKIVNQSNSNQTRFNDCAAKNQRNFKPNAKSDDNQSNLPNKLLNSKMSVINVPKSTARPQNIRNLEQYDHHAQHKSIVTKHNQSHANSKPFVCKICFKQFLSSHHLGCHSRDHAKQFPFRCSKCGRRFDDKTKHKSHTEHCKPFKCNICGISFGYKHHVERHMIVHRLQIKFQCSKCQNGFVYEMDKNHHERKCQDRQYECHLCKHSTLRLANMQEHMRIHHTGAKPSKCLDSDIFMNGRLHL